jgi:hypothetical protein
MTILKWATLVIVISFLATSSITLVNAHKSSTHHEIQCKWPYSALRVYTMPTQKICIIMEHEGKIINATSGAPFK